MQRIAKYNASACIALGSHISSLNSSASSSIPALSGGGFSHENHHRAAQLQLLTKTITNSKYIHGEFKIMFTNLKNIRILKKPRIKQCLQIQKILALN